MPPNSVDPQDMDTLIDIVLHEPFIETSGSVYGHIDRDEARAEILSMISENKARPANGRNGDVPEIPDEYKNDEDPFEVIKRGSLMDEEALDLKRQHVDAMFELKDKLAERTNTDTPRAESLRRMLGRKGISDCSRTYNIVVPQGGNLI